MGYDDFMKMLDGSKDGSKSLGQDSVFEQPGMFHNVDGEIKLGMDAQTFASVGINLSELNEHILIAGRAGAGKTSLIYNLLLQLMEKDIPFWAFDFKNDYRHLQNYSKHHKGGRKFLIFNPLTFRFNPLRPPQGVSPDFWIQVFVSIFGYSFYLLSGGSNLLVSQVSGLYRDYGVYNGSNNYPTIHDLFESLSLHRKKNAFHAGQSMSEKEYVGRCLNRLQGLCISLKDFLDCDRGFLPEKLLDSNVVLELQGLINDNETFVINIILAYLLQFKLANNLRGSGLGHVLVFDEAKKVFSAQKEFTPEFLASPMAVFASQIREFGHGLIVADQIPSELGKSIRENAYTRVCLSLSGGDSVRTMSNDMMLTPEQAAYTQQLVVDYNAGFFEGIVKFQRYPYPFLARFPFPKISKTIDDRIVYGHMGLPLSEMARDLILRTPVTEIWEAQKAEEERKKEEEKLRKAEGERKRKAAQAQTPPPQQPIPPQPAQQPSSQGQPAPPQPSAQPAPQPPPAVPGNVLIKFLLHIYEKPFLDVTDRYKELGFSSTASANDVKDQLIGKGLVEKVVVNRGYKKGNVTLFEITPAGMEYAKIDKVEIPGKGSFEHKYWQHIIKGHFKKLGHFADIEANFGGKNVDVGVYFKSDDKDGRWKNSEQWAVEVELTPANFIANVWKDAPPCDKVLICVKSEDKKKTYQKLVEQAFDKETLEKVEFKVLGEFIAV